MPRNAELGWKVLILEDMHVLHRLHISSTVPLTSTRWYSIQVQEAARQRLVQSSSHQTGQLSTLQTCRACADLAARPPYSARAEPRQSHKGIAVWQINPSP